MTSFSACCLRQSAASTRSAMRGGSSSGHRLTAEGVTPTAFATADAVPPSSSMASVFFMMEPSLVHSSLFGKSTQALSWLNTGMTSLEARLTEISKDLKLSWADIARAAGRSGSAVTLWRKEGAKMSMDSAHALQKKTGYRAEWIAFGRGAKKVVPEDEDMLEPAERRFLEWFRDLTPTEQADEIQRVQEKAEHNREVARMLDARRPAADAPGHGHGRARPTVEGEFAGGLNTNFGEEDHFLKPIGGGDK